MKLSIRTKLLAAFALDLLLMVALGTVALYQMSTMNSRAAQIKQYTIPSLDIVDKFNFVITKYRSLQLEYLINTSTADKDRIEREMADQEAAMAAYMDNYQPLITTNRQRDAFERLEQAWQRLRDANHRQFLPTGRLSNNGTVQPAFNRMNLVYRDLTIAVQDLIQESQRQATADLSVLQVAYWRARSFILADTAMAIIISALIGIVLATTIARRVKHLTVATQAVAGGDLDQQVAVPSQDEIGVLATNFNQMVRNLNEQRALLEQRNGELQASLERQRQLTSDLIRRSEAEAAAQQAQAVAEEASRAKTMFLATMSHELRTPLNAVLGYAQLLRARVVAAGQPELLAELERIRVAGKHLLTIINNLLDFSKIEQGKMNLHLTEFAVAPLAHEVVDLILPLAAERGNRVTVDIATAVGTMTSDDGKLRQILFNLLANAVKFTEQGLVQLVISRTPDGDDDWLVFEVSDTGIGISAEQQALLFQPFTQADASTTRRYGGSGLGLALSTKLCELLGGTISVASSLGQGSTFNVRLPANIDPLFPLALEEQRTSYAHDSRG